MNILDHSEVTGDVLSILLLQIAPSKEEEAAKALGKTALVYKGLGKYDLIAVTEEDGFQFSDEKKAFLNTIRGNLPPGTLDWMTICGFRITLPKQQAKKIKGENVLGVCCIKLALDGSTSALELEQKLIARLLKTVENTHVFSGLGYNEIICMVERKTIDELTSAINKIKEISMEDGNSLFLDINTIPAVKFDCLQRPNAIEGDITATVMVNLKTGAPTKIAPLLEKYLGSPGELLFGFHDIIVNVSTKTDPFLKNLVKLRAELAQLGLYSTCTLVRHLDTELVVQPKVPWESKDEYIKKIDEDMPPDLIYYHDLYRVLRNDPFTHSLILNLNHVLDVLWNDYQQAMDDLTAGNIDEYKESMDTYYAILSVINSFLRQRLSGVHVGNLLGAKGVSFETIGGVQRLIYALESVPDFLITTRGLKWDGFAIYGHYHSYRSWFSHEILAMPTKYLLKPEYIWGMNHETGHLIFLKLIETDTTFESSIDALYQRQKQSIKELLEGEEKDIPDDKILDFFIHHFSDVFADFLDFSYGFKGEWELYKKTLWSFLRDFGPNNPIYVTRSLLVYLILGPGLGKNQETAKDQFFKELKEFFPELREKFDDTKMNAVTLADRLFDTAVLLSSDMKTYLKSVNSAKIEEEVSVIRRVLLDGKLIINADPTLVVQALLTMGNVPRARFSAILSLYDHGCKRYINA